jgi:hypothetical protein
VNQRIAAQAAASDDIYAGQIRVTTTETDAFKGWIEMRRKERKMKWLLGRKQTDRSPAPIFSEVDTHKWASKIELQRLIGGKAELKPAGSGPK